MTASYAFIIVHKLVEPLRRIEITFLGTSAGAPTRERGLSAVLVHDGKRYILLDCGEGTQYKLLNCDVSVHRIDIVLITHLHGDHVFGLPGLLASMTLLGRTRELVVIGPVGIYEYLSCNIKFLGRLPFPLKILEIEPPSQVQEVLRQDDLKILTVKTRHTCESVAFSLVWKIPLGKFNPEKARALGVPTHLWKQLHYGEPVVLPDGRVVRPEEVVTVTTRGYLKLTYTGDTAPCEEVVELAQESDVLIHEATFSADEKPEDVWPQGHSRTVDAAEIALRARVRKLILTHISSRYAGQEDKLLQEARRVFPNTYIARDLEKYYISV